MGQTWGSKLFQGLTDSRHEADRGELSKSPAWQAKADDLVRYAPTGIYEIEFRPRRFLTVNDAMTGLTGYSGEELLAIDPMDLLDEAGKQLFETRLERMVSGDVPSTDVEYTIVRKDGRTIFVLLNIQFTYDETGIPRGAFVIAHDITDRRNAEIAVRRSRERFKLLSDANALLLSAADPEAVIADISERVMRLVDADLYLNYVVDEIDGALRLNAYGGIDADMAKGLDRLELGASVDGRAAREGSRVLVQRGSADPGADLLDALGVEAYACYPLYGTRETRGTLSFGTTKASFSEEDIEFVGTVADHVSVAIGRSRSERALSENENRQAFLLGLSDRLRPLSNPAEVRAAAAEAIGRQLSIASVSYVEVEQDQDMGLIGGEFSDGRLPALRGWLRLTDFGLPEEFLESGRELYVEDYQEAGDGSAVPEAVVRMKIRSVACIPLMKDGRLVAYMYAADSAPRLWAESERSLLRDVAERTWAAVERARAEERERRELDRTSILRDLASAAASSLDRRELSQRVMTVLENRVGADRGGVYLLEDPRGPAFHVAGFGFSPTLPGAGSTPVDDSTMGGKAMITGQVQVSGEGPIAHRPRAQSIYASLEDHRMVAIPMISRGEVIGCIALTFPGQRTFYSHEIAFFEAIADQLAVGYEGIVTMEERARQLDLTECLQEAQKILLTSDSDDVVSDAISSVAPRLSADAAAYATRRRGRWAFTPVLDSVGVFQVDDVQAAIVHALEASGPPGAGNRSSSSSFSHVMGTAARGFVVAPIAARTHGALVFSRQTGAFSQAQLAFVDKLADLIGLSLRERGIREERDWLSSARREWLAGISHDLRTPLASIRGYAELLSTSGETPADEVRRQAGLIANQSLRIQSLISDMLLTFQIEGGDLPMTSALTDLRAVAQQSVESLRDDPRSAGRTVVLEPEGQAFANLDSKLLRRAAENLILNGLVHNPPGTTIRVSVAADDTTAELVVADDGIGMDDETLQRIGKRFVRGPGTSSDTDGVGLGMSTTRQLVEVMNGELVVETAPGEGTTTRMRFEAAAGE